MLKINTDDNGAYTPDEAITGIQDFMNVVSGDDPRSEREGALLLTTEHVRQIRRYIKAGQELPLELSDVRRVMGNYDSNIAGLEPETIRDLYQEIHDHTSSWSPIERNMKEVGSDLHVFAGSLVVTVDELVEHLKQLPSYLQMKVDDLTPEQIAALPPVELVPGDRKQLDAMTPFFEEILSHVRNHSESTTKVKDGVFTFQDQLRNRISVQVIHKSNLASSHEADEQATKLVQEMADLEVRIRQKADEYERAYSNAKGGLLSPPFGFIVTSIYGAKAAQALREKNDLVARHQELGKKLKLLNAFLESLKSLGVTLQDMRMRIDDAITGVSQMESLWIMLANLITTSQRSLETLNDAVKLITLVLRLKAVSTSWSKIENQSLRLLTVFDNALKEN